MYQGLTLDGKLVKGDLEYHGMMPCICTRTASGYQVSAVNPHTIEFVDEHKPREMAGTGPVKAAARG